MIFVTDRPNCKTNESSVMAATKNVGNWCAGKSYIVAATGDTATMEKGLAMAVDDSETETARVGAKRERSQRSSPPPRPGLCSTRVWMRCPIMSLAWPIGVIQ